MRYIIMTPPNHGGTSWHLAHFDSYVAAVKSLALLSDLYDVEAELWERDTIRARYFDGRVNFEPGAAVVSL